MAGLDIKIPETLDAEGEALTSPRFLLAVSGGMDSMCLLHAFAREVSLKSFAVAHFNHRTRGKENEEDAALVRRVAERLGVEFFSGSRQQIGPAPEETLRNLRREFLEQIAEAHGFDFICTAHHANDQFETVLMRLLRGTDWRGMGGIRYQQGKWLRPLLYTTREDIEKYARKENVGYRSDFTNYQTKYFRNAIRHGVSQELLQVAENFGMSRNAALANISEWCRRAAEVQEFLDGHVGTIVDNLVVASPYWVRVECKAWAKVPKQLKPHALNLMAERYLGTTLCRQQLKLWQKNLRKEQKRFHLKEGVKVRVSMGFWYLLLGEEEPQIAPEFIGEKGMLTFSEIQTDLQVAGTPGELSWEPRYFQPGDRLEMSGKKLKEIFQRRRIPAPERKWIPVLARPKSSQVLWYLGAEEASIPVAMRRCEFPFSREQ